MRSVSVVTVGRSDYSIYLPVLAELRARGDVKLDLIVSGSHLAPEFGRTVDVIRADGHAIADQVEMLLSSDTPEGMAKSMGLGLIGFGASYARRRPDLLVVLGDRFEMHAAALAALPFGIPIAHIHGGELTLGAIDDALRHSITKLSHLHFVSTAAYGQRVVQLGEAPWRVLVSGAPSLDNLSSMQLLEHADFEEAFGVAMAPAPLLVTFHSVTTGIDRSGEYIDELLAALGEVGEPVLFTMPNPDAGGRTIRERVIAWTNTRTNASAVENLGPVGYFSAMRMARAMVGNSSSGIVEAASLKLPVVNIGTRQEGRIVARNVVSCDHSRAAIVRAIREALAPGFATSLTDLENPYGDGKASQRIAERIATVALDETLTKKRFHDAGAP